MAGALLAPGAPGKDSAFSPAPRRAEAANLLFRPWVATQNGAGGEPLPGDLAWKRQRGQVRLIQEGLEKQHCRIPSSLQGSPSSTPVPPWASPGSAEVFGAPGGGVCRERITGDPLLQARNGFSGQTVRVGTRKSQVRPGPGDVWLWSLRGRRWGSARNTPAVVMAALAADPSGHSCLPLDAPLPTCRPGRIRGGMQRSKLGREGQAGSRGR